MSRLPYPLDRVLEPMISARLESRRDRQERLRLHPKDVSLRIESELHDKLYLGCSLKVEAHVHREMQESIMRNMSGSWGYESEPSSVREAVKMSVCAAVRSSVISNG